MKNTRSLAYPYLLWMAIFIIVPTLMLLYYAFSGPGGITLDNFIKIFQGSTLKTIWLSIRIAFVTSLITLLIGYPFAYFMTKLNIKYRTLSMMLIMVPMWMNFLLRTYAWVTILSPNGVLSSFLALFGIEYTSFLYTEGAVILGMVYNYLPFMILPIYTSLEKIDNTLIEASYDLGANKRQTFWKVIFPMSIPGIVSGITMVFIPVISTFEVADLLGGGKVNMVGNVIERAFTKTGDWGYGSALATLLMLMILITMLFDKQGGDTGGLDD